MIYCEYCGTLSAGRYCSDECRRGDKSLVLDSDVAKRRIRFLERQLAEREPLPPWHVRDNAGNVFFVGGVPGVSDGPLGLRLVPVDETGEG